MHTHPFDGWFRRPVASLFDVVIISWNYTSVKQAIECVKWMTPEQTLIVLGPLEDEHSASFWHIFQSLMVLHQVQGNSSRMLLLQKTSTNLLPALSQPAAERMSLQRGDRFHLASGARWPGRNGDDRPPVVEIVRDWDRDSGPVKIVKTGVVFYIQKGDLGTPM
jgi:hypothetical protein